MEEKCCCGGKRTERTEEERKKLIHRLNRIEGQIRGLRGMIEKDAYCADVLRDIRAGKDEAAEELADVLKKLIK